MTSKRPTAAAGRSNKGCTDREECNAAACFGIHGGPLASMLAWVCVDGSIHMFVYACVYVYLSIEARQTAADQCVTRACLNVSF